LIRWSVCCKAASVAALRRPVDAARLPTVERRNYAER